MTILSALEDEIDLNVVATVGLDRDPADLGVQPPHIHVARFIPQTAVMARADLAICHGGSGAIMGALTAGVPMLLLPQGADQFDNAPRCVERGVARVLDHTDLSATAIRDEARILLEDGRYGRAATEVAAEIGRLPGASHAVELLEQLARTRTPVLAR